MSAKASAYMKALTVCPNGEMISPREKLVGMVLADSHQDRAGHFTYPAVETIAEESVCDKRSAQRYLAALERKGVIYRMRPPNQGRSMRVFYFFCELDTVPEGWQGVTLFSGKRVAEGWQKGDRRVTESRAALLERAQEREQEQQEQQKQIPPNPQGADALGGDGESKKALTPDREIDGATDRVMRAIGATARRLAKKIRAQVALRVQEFGEGAEQVADRMIAAYERQAENCERLFRVVPAAEFFETGLWMNARRWNWDQQALREENLRAQAGVGTYTPQ